MSDRYTCPKCGNSTFGKTHCYSCADKKAILKEDGQASWTPEEIVSYARRCLEFEDELITIIRQYGQRQYEQALKNYGVI